MSISMIRSSLVLGVVVALVSSSWSCKARKNASAAKDISTTRSGSGWLDATTTDGTTPSTCVETPANCTMLDVKSVLMWSKILPDDKSWQGAMDACAALTHNGKEAGSWRLPARDELSAASDNGITDAARGDWISSENMRHYFWSVSSYNSSTVNVWTVNLANGKAFGSPSYNKYGAAVVCVWSVPD